MKGRLGFTDTVNLQTFLNVQHSSNSAVTASKYRLQLSSMVYEGRLKQSCSGVALRVPVEVSSY